MKCMKICFLKSYNEKIIYIVNILNFVLEHLSRLHMILKPFMLRRIKKDVENELSDKIEVMVYCPLTTRQKLLYSGNLIFNFLCIY